MQGKRREGLIAYFSSTTIITKVRGQRGSDALTEHGSDTLGERESSVHSARDCGVRSECDTHVRSESVADLYSERTTIDIDRGQGTHSVQLQWLMVLQHLVVGQCLQWEVGNAM